MPIPPSPSSVHGYPNQYPAAPPGNYSGFPPPPPAPIPGPAPRGLALHQGGMDDRYPGPAKKNKRSGRNSKSKRRDSSSDDESSIGSRSTRSSKSGSTRSGSTRSSTSGRRSTRHDKNKHRSSRYFDGDQDSGMGSSDSDPYVDDRKASRSKSKSRSRRDRDRSSRRSIGSSPRSASIASTRSSIRSRGSRRASTTMAKRRSRSRKGNRDESSDESDDSSSSSTSTSSRRSSRRSLSSRATSMSSKSGRSSVSAYTYKDRSGRKKSRSHRSDSESDGPASIATTRPGRDRRKSYKPNTSLPESANQVGFAASRKESAITALAQVLANSSTKSMEISMHRRSKSCPPECVACALRKLSDAFRTRSDRSFEPFRAWAHDQGTRDPAQLLKRALAGLNKPGCLSEALPYFFQTGTACIHGHGAVEARRPSNFYPIKVSTRGVKTLDGALRKFAKSPVPKDWELTQCEDRDCRARSHKDRASKTSRGEPYYSPRIFRGPQKLVIVLDRYPKSKSDRRSDKDRSVIKCPPLLSIDPVVPKSKRSDHNDTDYELNAVICDKGQSPGSGPYVTYVKTAGDGWVKYDERGSPPKRVSAGYAHENRDAYMLFYGKAISNQSQSSGWTSKNRGTVFTRITPADGPPSVPFFSQFF